MLVGKATMHNSTNLIATPALMVDNLAEKVDWVWTKSGSLSIVCIQLWAWKLFIKWSSGICTIQGLLEVKGRTVGTFEIVCYIVGICCWGVSIKRGSTVLQSFACNLLEWILWKVVGTLVRVAKCWGYFFLISSTTAKASRSTLSPPSTLASFLQ